MPRTLRERSLHLLAAGAFVFAIPMAACEGGRSNSSGSTEAPAPVPQPKATDGYQELPLEALSPEAVQYLLTRGGSAGVAVVVPERSAVYTWNGAGQFHMASVAKVTIMVTLMQQSLEEGRRLTEAELEEMRPMITVSDNASASRLWEQVGGGPAVEVYLRSLGLSDVHLDQGSEWGESTASPRDIALLFAKLALGEILDWPMRDTAIALLQQVVASQAWGVPAASPEGRPEGSVVAVKDGWYPAEGGWRVNSAAILLPGNEKPAYTMAVLTGEQPDWGYGIETIETVSAMVHARLHGD